MTARLAGVTSCVTPPTAGDVVAALAEWLLRDGARVVLSLERDGSLRFAASAPPSGEPPAVRAACSSWALDGATLTARLDPAAVTGALDEPGTLFALHALAARMPQSRLILKLPPEHVGRRW